MPKSEAELAFKFLWKRKGLPGSDLKEQYEIADHEPRWKFDFAFPSQKLLIEIDGMPSGSRGGRGPALGGHSTAEGLRNDCQKRAAAARLGWRVLVFSTADYDVEDWVYTVTSILCFPDGQPD